MDLLFVIDAPDSLKAYKDTTVTMMRAAEARGHAVHVCEQPSLAWHAGSVAAEAMRIHLTDNDEDWYRRDGHARRPLSWYDAVLMRKDPPFDLEYVTSTWLLSAAVREGARVFNAPDAIRDHNEKLAIAEFPAFVAPTLPPCQARAGCSHTCTAWPRASAARIMVTVVSLYALSESGGSMMKSRFTRWGRSVQVAWRLAPRRGAEEATTCPWRRRAWAPPAPSGCRRTGSP